MTDTTEELRAMILAYMQRNGLSQGGFAKALGVKQATVSHWLTGKGGFTHANEGRVRALCEGTDPVRAYKERVITALIACDQLSGEARAVAVQVVQGLQ